VSDARTPKPGRTRLRDSASRSRLAVVAPLALLGAGAALAALIAVITDPGPPSRAPASPDPGALAPGPAGGAAASSGSSPGSPPVPIPVSAGSAEEHMALARRLLEANRADAAGATREGLLQAEAEVQAALGLGLPDLSGARRLLADVNGALARDWAAADHERRAYQQREREALRALLEVRPDDGEARYRYAILLDDRGRRVEELRRAVRASPRDYRPHRALGEDLLELGRSDEGARLLLDAAELCSQEELGHQGPDIVHLLRLHGREEEEARLRERMERLGY